MRPSASGGLHASRKPAAVALLLAFATVAGGSAPAQEPVDSAPQRHVFLWEISSPGRSGAVLYLLGSTHASRRPHEQMDPAIEQAFAAADKLVVEVDTLQTRGSDIQRYARELGRIADGSSLGAWVSPQIHEALRAALRQQGMRPDALDGLEPWLAALTLTGNALSRLGYDPSFGVEEYFLERVQDRAVLELEGARAQLQVLDALSREVQEAMLERTLRELGTLNHTITALSDSWQEGDAERMRTLLFGAADRAPGKAALDERLYFARNRDMVQKLAVSLEQGGVWFAVIGAGHMLGEQGIPALFAERGYRVEQIAAQAAPLPPVSEEPVVGFAVLR